MVQVYGTFLGSSTLLLGHSFNFSRTSQMQSITALKSLEQLKRLQKENIKAATDFMEIINDSNEGK